MHALVSDPIPAHDEKTDAVLIYSEKNVTVLSADKIKTQMRKAYKILRPGGREYGEVVVPFSSPGQKVTSLHGWCIPAQGKDYEVKDKDAMEVSLPKVEGSELVSDLRAKLLRIPASDPGNIIGYEYEIEAQPLVLQNSLGVPRGKPGAREPLLPTASLRLGIQGFMAQLPGSQADCKAEAVTGNGRTSDERVFGKSKKCLRWKGSWDRWLSLSSLLEGRLPEKDSPVGAKWGIGTGDLTSGRRDATPDMKQKVGALTSSMPDTVDKMQALAQFLQHDIRYVGIELGIGGFQPHTAPDVFTHHYGDCKDKATLMSSMLHEIWCGFVLCGDQCGARLSHPGNARLRQWFNHVIVAIGCPMG